MRVILCNVFDRPGETCRARLRGRGRSRRSFRVQGEEVSRQSVRASHRPTPVLAALPDCYATARHASMRSRKRLTVVLRSPHCVLAVAAAHPQTVHHPLPPFADGQPRPRGRLHGRQAGCAGHLWLRVGNKQWESRRGRTHTLLLRFRACSPRTLATGVQLNAVIGRAAFPAAERQRLSIGGCASSAASCAASACVASSRVGAQGRRLGAPQVRGCRWCAAAGSARRCETLEDEALMAPADKFDAFASLKIQSWTGIRIQLGRSPVRDGHSPVRDGQDFEAKSYWTL